MGTASPQILMILLRGGTGATGEEKEERKGVNKGGTWVFLITIEQKINK